MSAKLRSPLSANMIFALAVAFGSAHSQADRTEAADSLVGDWVGFWECVDPETHRVLRTVELKSNGACVEIPRVGKGSGFQGRFTMTYRAANSSLELRDSNYSSGQPSYLIEKGRVKWIGNDGKLVQYTLETGDQFRFVIGKCYEFHRLTGPDDPRSTKNIAGLWEALLPIGGSWRVEIGRNGTCRDLSNQRSAFFRYKDRIFAAMSDPDDERTLVERGVVVWIDKDNFVFKYPTGSFFGAGAYPPDTNEIKFHRASGAPVVNQEVTKIEPPGGKEGDYTGLWECVKQTSGLRIRIVEFKTDGTAVYCGSSDEYGQGQFQRRVFGYRGTRESLTITCTADIRLDLPNGQGGLTGKIWERGHVTWNDGDMFTFIPNEGIIVHDYQDVNQAMLIGIARGQRQEFHRLGSPRGAKAVNLLGDWFVRWNPLSTDPRQGKPDIPDDRFLEDEKQNVFNHIRLDRRGTYFVTRQRFHPSEPAQSYFRYKDGILSFEAIDDRGFTRLRLWRGLVKSETNDSFTFTVIDGAVAKGKYPSEVYTFERRK
jgi:hypothetical protein